MDKIWLNHYEAGVPSDINPDRYSSLIAMVDQACSKYASKTALVNYGSSMTYAELDHASKQFASFLQHQLRVQKGDRVAIMMPNLMQYIVAMIGALRLGAVIVNVNPLYTAPELEHQLRDSGASVLVVLANFANTVAQVIPNLPQTHVVITELGDCLGALKGRVVNFVVRYIKKMVPAYQIPNAIMWPQAMRQGAQRLYQPVALCGSDLAYLQYTGGTTGVAKGAMLTHRNLVANVEQANAWVHSLLKPGHEIVVTPLPLYHIFSLTANCWFFLKIGAKNILITNPRDIHHMVRDLKGVKFTAITGVNTLFNALLRDKDFRELNFSKLKITLGGGMAVQREVAERWRKVTGCTLLQAYGLTETSPAVTINRALLQEFNGSIGLPLPSTDIKIINPAGETVPLGERGELCVRGPQVMLGYWNMVDETKNVLSEDGWLRTGDIATIDEEGRVFIVDRNKDMILVSGFNVYPNEIEDVIAHHPGVREVGVVGLPDAQSGEVVAAFIVRHDPNLTVETLDHFCRQHLTAYKVPKQFNFVKELPKSNVGKILRRALRDMYS